jgi:hypothetical protein
MELEIGNNFSGGEDDGAGCWAERGRRVLREGGTRLLF